MAPASCTSLDETAQQPLFIAQGGERSRSASSASLRRELPPQGSPPGPPTLPGPPLSLSAPHVQPYPSATVNPTPRFHC